MLNRLSRTRKTYMYKIDLRLFLRVFRRELDDVLGRLRECDDLGFASGQRDALLLAGAPRERGRLPEDKPSRGGSLCLP